MDESNSSKNRNTLTPKQILDTLTPQEKKILEHYVVENMTWDQIGKDLVINRDTVRFHRDNIYEKLGVSTGYYRKHRAERKQEIIRTYKPLLEKPVESVVGSVGKSGNEKWVEEEIKLGATQTSATEQQPATSNTETDAHPPQTHHGQRTIFGGRLNNWLIYILLGIIALLSCVVMYKVIPIIPSGIPALISRNTESVTFTPEVVAEVSASSTEASTITSASSGETVPNEPPVIPTDTPSATPTSTTTPTETPTPTNTSTPTETPIPTPTPEIIFFDDFSGDLSKWTQLGLPPYYPNNKVVIANDAMTTSDSYGAWVKAEIPAETNYQIIINFKGNGCGGDGNYFSPAFIDTSNMISFNADACHYLWGYTEGSTTLNKYPETTGLNGPGDSEVIITVKGNKLLAILNKGDAGSVFNDKYPQGIIAIFIRTGDSVDDVTVIALQE